MLEFVVPEQFEAEAKSLLCQHVVPFPGSERPKTLEGILNEFKGEEIAPRMSAYSVKYNEDGTTVVLPFDMGFGGNEYELERYLEDGGQTIMLVREGKSICIAPFRINDEVYLRTFDAEQAQSIRETMTAQLPEPKKPSAYDKI